jgi:hypothetical protein
MRRVDGILYAPRHARQLQPPNLDSIPVVLVDAGDSESSFAAVVPDEGAASAVDEPAEPAELAAFAAGILMDAIEGAAAATPRGNF